MIIRPYSDASLFAAGGPCELNATNFPFLVHAFTADGMSDDLLTLTDAIGDVVIASSTGFVEPAAGQFRAGGVISKQSGDWGTLGTKDALVICTGSFSASTISPFTIGDATNGPAIQVNGGAGYFAVFNATNYATFATLSGSYPLLAEATLVNNDSAGTGNGTCTTYGCNAATSYNAAATVTLDIAQTWGQYGNSSTHVAITSGATSHLTGIYVCHFTTAPSDIAAAIAWMSQNPGKMYPACKGYHL